MKRTTHILLVFLAFAIVTIAPQLTQAATYASASFTAAFGTPLENYTSDTGGSWIIDSTASSTYASSSLTIYNGSVFDTVATNTQSLYYESTVIPTADYSVEADIIGNSSNGSSVMGVAGRVSTTSNTAVWGNWNTSGWQIVRYINGVLVAINGSTTPAVVNGQTFHLRLALTGSRGVLYVNGLPVVSTTLLTAATSTTLNAGLDAHIAAVGSISSTTRPSLDNFKVIDNDVTAPVISGITASTSSTTATIAWNTDELASSTLNYGTTSAYGSFATSTTFSTSHSMTLTGLTAGTTYHYQIAASDYSANTSTTTDTTFTTQSTGGGDVTPPVLSAIASTASTTGATITWTTDENSTSQVEYGTSTTYTASSTLDATLVTSHSVPLSGLLSSTTYHFRVLSKDASSNLATSTDNTFTTLAVTAPTVTTSAASSIATSSAVFNGSITSDGNASSTVRGFNYGLTTSYGATTTQSGTFGVGSFSASTTGLTPSTTYHYRAYATNTAGTSYGADQQFTTGALSAPVISGIASSTTQTSATITWTTDQAASSTVNYGATTAYGTASTSAALVTSHSITITGLTANSTYHFQVGGANSAGTISTSSDQTLTTAALPVTAPSLSVSAASSVSTSTATLNGSITADGNASSTVRGFNYGTTTAYGLTASTTGTYGVGSYSIAVSGLLPNTLYHYRAFATNGGGTGTSTDQTFTTSSLPDTTAPTVAVTAPSSGATVGGSSVTLTASSSDNVGVTGVQFYRDSNVAIGSQGTGNPYSVAWDSTGVSDGSHSIFAVAHDAAGNYATSTSVSVTIDNTAPTLSAIAATTTLSTATITWTTGESATTRVDYGLTSSYGTASTSAGLSASHTIVLSGLANSTTYHYRVQSADATGNTATSTDLTFTTGTPDTTAPIVSITAPTNGSTVSGSSVSLTASSSDNVAVAGVQFRVDGISIGSEDTTPAYGVTWDSTTVADGTHTLYAVARDTSNNYATSSVSVTVDNTAPSRSAGSPSTALPHGTSSTTISLTTNEAATCKYSTTPGVAYTSMTNTFATTGGTTHSQSVTGLQNNTAYTYYVKCQDGQGNKNVSDYAISFSVLGDSTVPTVSMTAPANNAVVGGSSVMLSATASDDVAVTGLQFLLDGAPLGSLFTTAPYTYSWDTTGVASGTHALAAVANDGSGNYATSTAVSVRVDNDAPVASAVTAASITSGGATIMWTTDENSTSQVDYGTTTSYGSQTTLDSTRVKAHSVAISGLSPSTTYHYRVRSSDSVGNSLIGTDHTFTTAAAGADTTPPVITNVSASAAQDTATVTWTTDEPASSQVAYGPTSSYGSQTVLDSTLTTSHSVTVSGLSSGTTYHFQVMSADAASNAAASADATFTTTQPASQSHTPGQSVSPAAAAGGPVVVTVNADGTVTVTPVGNTTTMTTGSVPSLTRDLTVGSTGADVTALQQFLIAKGFSIPAGATGYFGAQTVAALAAYQAANGIVPAAGYLGPVTRAAIAALGGATTPSVPASPITTTTTTTTTVSTAAFSRDLTVGSTGSDVLALQKYLNAHGFTVAASGAGSAGNETTTFGAATKSALAKFQASVGISPAAGYFGPTTRAYIASH